MIDGIDSDATVVGDVGRSCRLVLTLFAPQVTLRTHTHHSSALLNSFIIGYSSFRYSILRASKEV